MLKAAVSLLALGVLCIAIFGYYPLPPEVKSPFVTQLEVARARIRRFIIDMHPVLGLESPYKNLSSFQDKPTLIGDVYSSTLGDVKVWRANVSNIPVIIYKPHTCTIPSPALIYLHGGGWVFGTTDMFDLTTYDYANKTNTIVISVEYRKAPAHPFPIPVQDCLDVTKYLLRHGADLDIDVRKIGIVGDSAGGNMAAAVALTLARERSSALPPLVLQILHYPVLQAFDLRLPSYVDNNHTIPTLTPKAVGVLFASYMGLEGNKTEDYAQLFMDNRHISPQLRKSKFGSYISTVLLPQQYRIPSSEAPIPITAPYDEKLFNRIKHILTNPLFSPLVSPDLSGLPPAFIHVCQYDILRDDGLLYARRLQDAGVKVHLHFGGGGFHGDSFIRSRYYYPESGRIARQAAYSFVKKHLRTISDEKVRSLK